jgi:hypothetical protein
VEPVGIKGGGEEEREREKYMAYLCLPLPLRTEAYHPAESRMKEIRDMQATKSHQNKYLPRVKGCSGQPNEMTFNWRS